MSIDTLLKNDSLLDEKSAVKSYLESLFDSTASAVAVSATVAKEIEPVRLTGQNVPHWAASGFSALNFRSGGYHLYVPVTFVRGIKNIGGRIAQVKGAAEWIKGVVRTKSTTITVIDTEKLVMAETRKTVGYQHPDQNAYVILLGSGSFGLSCDTIGQVKQVAAQDIHWRDTKSRHRWVAGMFQQEVAALIDARRVALAVSMDSTLV